MEKQGKSSIIEEHYLKLEGQYGIEFLSPGDIKEALRDYVKTSDFSDPDIQHFCIMGEPGGGKTAIPNQIAREEDVELITIRASNIDEGVLSGYPGPSPESPGAVDLFFVKFYKDRLDKAIASGKKIMIFFDELNRAKDHIIQSTFNIIDRKVIANYELPKDRTMFMVSINPATDAHTVRDIIGKEAALNRRFEVYGMKSDAKSFLDFADTVKDFHPIVKEYIRNYPDNLMGLDHMQAGKKFACPAIFTSFARQLTAMEKSGINLLTLRKHPTKIRRMNAAFGTGEGPALLNFILDRSRHITPSVILEDYDKVQPLIKGEKALVLDSGDNGMVVLDMTKDGSEEALDYGQLSKLAGDVAAYIAKFQPNVQANPAWAKNIARFMNDLHNDALKMFLEKLHINMQTNIYSEDLVKALAGIDEFKEASHRAHRLTRDAAKATEQK
jgi:hypothetical protein